MVLAKAVTLYTVWNAFGATLNMKVKQKTESLIHSKVIILTSHTNNTTVAWHFHSHKISWIHR